MARFGTNGGTIYFKGGRDRIEDEAALTQALAALRPRQFPETLAIDREHHRWVYRSLPGTPLSDGLQTMEHVRAAARALASLQKAVLAAPDVELLLAPRRADATELYWRLDRLLRGAEREAPDPLPADTERPYRPHVWHAMRDLVLRICTEADALGLPLTLVLSDFWAANILATPDGIGFIDVGNSYWSYGYLPLWRLVRNFESVPGMPTGVRAAIEEAFVDEWSDRIPRADMRRGLTYLPILGQIFGILMASCDLDDHERALGSPLPPGYRRARLAPRVRALLMACALRTFGPEASVPRQGEPAAFSAPFTR